MPRGGGAAGGLSRGKKNYKGQRRHFTDENELKEQAKKSEREREWRRQHGVPSDHEEEAGADDEARAKNRDLPPSDSESGSEESSDEESKPKGVAHLIDIENPNRIGSKTVKKVTEMGEGGATNLSRREREEIQKQEARQRYQALHIAGKTEEAQADLARLAIIRKNREEAAKKREEELKTKDDGKGKGKSKEKS